MRAISLWGPYATLIADGRKLFETRTWTTTYRGPIAIHASSTVVAEYAVACGYKPEGLPRGAIVAVARLAGILTTEEAVRVIEDTMPAAQAREELAHGDYSPGRYAWELADVHAIPALWIPGRQGLWDVPPDVEIRLRMDAGLAGR